MVSHLTGPPCINCKNLQKSVHVCVVLLFESFGWNNLLSSGTSWPEWCHNWGRKRKSCLQSLQLKLQHIAKEEVVVVHIRHPGGSFLQHNVVEEKLFCEAEKQTMGQDLIPQDAQDPRSEAGDLNIESFTEKSGHKGVIPPGECKHEMQIQCYAHYWCLIYVYSLVSQCQFSVSNRMLPCHMKDLLAQAACQCQACPRSWHPEPPKAEVGVGSAWEFIKGWTVFCLDASLLRCPEDYSCSENLVQFNLVGLKFLLGLGQARNLSPSKCFRCSWWRRLGRSSTTSSSVFATNLTPSQRRLVHKRPDSVLKESLW